MPRKLRDAVVVITGASTGLGRAIALAFARRGVNLSLAARGEDALHQPAQEYRHFGSRTLVVPTDVTDEAAVQNLAQRTVQELGRLDIWVNNAAVIAFGRFEEIPSDIYRRVIETNLFGYIHGARAALPYFREQGFGTLINIASIDSLAGMPYTSPYVASKFAIRGFSESLREEMMGEPINICTIMPGSIDTPLFQHSANYSGRASKPVPPVYDPSEVAEAIVACAENPKREVLVGSSARMMAAFHGIAPLLYERMIARRAPKDHFTNIRTGPTKGNLFEPMLEWAGTRGGWRNPELDARRRRVTVGVLAGVAAMGLAFMMWRRRGNRASEDNAQQAAPIASRNLLRMGQSRKA
jgi:short-subunit dehydrogenase